MVRIGAYRRWKVQKYWPEHRHWRDFAAGYETQEDAEALVDELRMYEGGPQLRVVAEDYVEEDGGWLG